MLQRLQKGEKATGVGQHVNEHKRLWLAKLYSSKDQQM